MLGYYRYGRHVPYCHVSEDFQEVGKMGSALARRSRWVLYGPSAVQLYNLDLHAAVVVTSSRSSRSAGQQPLNDWNALEIERCVQSRRYIDVNIGAAGGTASREAVTQRRVYCARSSYHSLNPNILAQHKSIAASTY